MDDGLDDLAAGFGFGGIDLLIVDVNLDLVEGAGELQRAEDFALGSPGDGGVPDQQRVVAGHLQAAPVEVMFDWSPEVREIDDKVRRVAGRKGIAMQASVFCGGELGLDAGIGE